MAISIKNYFKKTVLNPELLIKYGFINNKLEFYSKDNRIRFSIELKNDDITLDAFDLDFNDESISFNSSNIIKVEWENKIEDIINKCSYLERYKLDQSKRLNQYIIRKYNCEAEFLFNDYPSFGVYRIKHNNKWFSLIMDIDYSKLDKNKTGYIEILNLKSNKIPDIIDNKTIFPAYHMNKKYWISIVLNDTISDDYIAKLIDESYELIK